MTTLEGPGGTLFVVATPIGNLSDISNRALQTLERVELVLAEDTRRTGALLAHFDMRRPLLSYHEHNEAERAAAALERLQAGASIALLTDAGTPTISDPGYRLVAAAAAAGIRIVPLPGASAPIAALMASGLPTHRFIFLGFAPRSSAARRKLFESLVGEPGTLIFFESPRRLERTLAEAAEVLGPRRPACVAREITKLHEEFLRGSLADILDDLARKPARGEVTVCVAGSSGLPKPVATSLSTNELRRRYEALLADGLERRQALRQLTTETGGSRREIYGRLFAQTES